MKKRPLTEGNKKGLTKPLDKEHIDTVFELEKTN